MSDTILLARDDTDEVVLEGREVRLVAVTGLGMAKLQVLADDPNAWFESALGIAPPAPLTEIAPVPVAIAWMAPGEWLVTGPEADVRRVRSRCAEAAGSFGLMIDITHGCAAFEIIGSAAERVLSAHCPLDLSTEAMPVDAACRSLFSDTGFFISRRPDTEGQPCFRLVFDQTMASYAVRLMGATISGVSL